MTLPEYLASPQSREDVRAALELPREMLPIQIDQHDAWKRVTLSMPAEEAISVYYLEQEGGFAVCDLGDGVKAYRLKHGLIWLPDDEARIILAVLGELDLFWEGPVLCDSHVMAEKLPDAICRVLLASWKVANLQKDLA